MNDAKASGTAPGPAERVLVVASALPLALIVCLTFADVFARYLFSAPIKGSVEIIQFAMALVIFTALPLVTRQRGHVSVSLIDGAVKGLARRAVLAASDLLSALALGIVTWRLWLQGLTDLKQQNTTIVLGAPQAPLTFTMAVFAFLATLAALRLLWLSLAGTGAEAGDTPP